MHTDLSLTEVQKEWHGSYLSYAIGFTASLLLTGTSFILVATKLFSPYILAHTIIILALLQAVFQLRFFLHLGQEASPKWETAVFFSMVLILLIIVVGSLWIMFDLNDRVMSHMVNEMNHD